MASGRSAGAERNGASPKRPPGPAPALLGSSKKQHSPRWPPEVTGSRCWSCRLPGLLLAFQNQRSQDLSLCLSSPGANTAPGERRGLLPEHPPSPCQGRPQPSPELRSSAFAFRKLVLSSLGTRDGAATPGYPPVWRGGRPLLRSAPLCSPPSSGDGEPRDVFPRKRPGSQVSLTLLVPSLLGWHPAAPTASISRTLSTLCLNHRELESSLGPTARLRKLFVPN